MGGGPPRRPGWRSSVRRSRSGRPSPCTRRSGPPRRPEPATARRPVQYLHVDDLADAVMLAWERRLSGVYNVAPDTGRARGRGPGPGRRGGQGHPAGSAGPRRGGLDLAAVAPGRAGRGPGLRHPSVGDRPRPAESGRLDAALLERRGAGGHRHAGALGRPAARAAARTTTCCWRSAGRWPWPAAWRARWRPGASAGGRGAADGSR